jgi:hypothetical protein
MNIGGKKINNWYVVGGAAGLGLVIYLYRRSSSGASSSTSSTSATGTDPLTGLPYSSDNTVDPLTGMTYLQEAQTYGSVAAADAQGGTGAGYGLAGSSGYGYTGTAGYPTSNVGAGSAAGQSYATNAAWAQAVQAGLSALGYDPQTVASALGLYFAQHPLSADQAQIIQAAEAEFGPPPQGTYQIIPQGSGTGTGTGTTGGGTTGGSTTLPGGVSGLHATSVTATSVGLAWNATSGAGSYDVELARPGSLPVRSTSATSYSFTGLKPNTAYTFYVAAKPSVTGHSAITVKTSAK